MAKILDGLNSMPWVSLGRFPNGWLIELAPAPPRDKAKYGYDLWSNGLAFEAFGIGRTYKASIRGGSYGDGMWLFNFDTEGRLVNASYTGTRWGRFEIPAPESNFRLLPYPRYRPEMHRLVGGTWLRAKWFDKIDSSRLTYRAEIVAEEDPLFQAAMHTLDEFCEALSGNPISPADPAAAELVQTFRQLPVKRCAELRAEAARFHSILRIDRPIPVEPPELAFDHYHAIPLKVQDGCGGSCTFCDLYERKIRVSPLSEVLRQADLMAEYFEEELDHFTKVVLLEGDGLTVPTDQLIDELNYASAKFQLGSPGFAHAFAKAVTVDGKSPQDLRRLKSEGLVNVNLGLESGCQKLLDLVKRGQTVDVVRRAVFKLCEADIGVSVNIVIGLGGVEFRDRHAQETAEFVRTLPSQVTVFYSPLQVISTSHYIRKQEAELGGALCDEDMIWQRQLFEQELGAYEYLFVPI